MMQSLRKQFIFLCSIFLIDVSQATNAPSLYGNSASIRFTENKGQVRDFRGEAHPEVKFLVSTGNLKIFVFENQLAYQFMKFEEKPKTGPDFKHDVKNRKRVETFRMDMLLEGANTRAFMTKEGMSSDYENHYTYKAYDVRHYSAVTFHEVYPGIDWVLQAREGKIKYEFVVRPGADPGQIKLRFLFHESLSVSKKGELVVGSMMGNVTEASPLSYQGTKTIETEFVIEKDIVSFKLSGYDPSQTLVIDPLVQWGSYYGGSGGEEGNSCASDAFGNIFLAGMTTSANNIASGGHQVNIGGTWDAFLVKFDAIGGRTWATYYGGASDDIGLSCATDASGNIFLAGFSESTSGIASGGHQNSMGGIRDLFLVKFDAIGSLVWGTYYGGSNQEDNANCTTDASGNIYLSGNTLSSNNISTTGSHQTYLMGGTDDFLVKFNANGVRQWGTYFGGYDLETNAACATDPSGFIYMCGNTDSYNNISLNGHENYLSGSTDAYLAKFSPAGTLNWATYYGSSYDDFSYACATDASGNVFLLGSTSIASNAGDLATPGAYITSVTQSMEAFLVKFSSSGTRSWGTFLGYSNYFIHDGLATDAQGFVYPGGVKLMKFSGSGGFVWENEEFSFGTMKAVSRAGSGKIAVAGVAISPMAVLSSGFQTTYGGNGDAYIALLSSCDPPPMPGAISGPSYICTNYAGVLNYSVAPIAGAIGYTWTLPSGWNGSSSSNAISVMPSNAFGSLMVASSGTCGFSSNQSLLLYGSNPPNVFIGNPGIYCQGMTAVLQASGADSYTWTNGPGSPIFSVTPLFATNYMVTGESFATGCRNTATITVSPDTTTIFNYTVNNMIVNLSIKNPACSSFEWDYGNGSGSTLNSNPVVTYVNPGTYGICLKCNGLPQACIRCLNITVPANRTGGVSIVESQPLESYYMFANPVRETLEISAPESSSFEMVNMLGVKMCAGVLQQGMNRINMVEYAPGLYVLTTKKDNNATSVKILKE